MIDDTTVRHVAALARLDLTPEQLQTYGAQLASILEYIEQLNAMNLEGVEPASATLDTPMRPDAPARSLPRSDALGNAPAADGACFIVPPVIE